MSEASDKVLGIRHLPIFPLPLVLLPNELLPLHIFEPRYRKMLKDVELEKNIFGVNYFEPPEEFIEKPANGSIGCAAEVREVQTLEDGRSNILTIGVIRYQIIDYVETGNEYLVADVEFFEDDEEDKAVLNPLADEVFALFKRIAKAAHKLSGGRGAFPEIPQAEPQALSFLVTAAFTLEARIKYQMLEMTSTVERLQRLREILLQTVDKMEENADIHKISQTNGHANKKIDF
jgi:Lon protease-like protein